ncbi:MAG: hypothetical protein QMD09_00495, partial [Desulfatibacillaceae bacterium]|nr:hypothetical protein [Desulfatibacillaceae bacterium]
CFCLIVETAMAFFNHNMLWAFTDKALAIVNTLGLKEDFCLPGFWVKVNDRPFFCFLITFFVDNAVLGAYLVVQSNPAESRYQLRATPTADEMLWFLQFGGPQSRVIATR